MIIYVNGQMIDAKKAVVSVYDHGFLYGLGLFETFRTYKGSCFLLEAHMERLKEACTYVGITMSLTSSQVQHIVQELMEENDLEEAYVRLTISAGEGELGLPTSNYTEPTIVVMVKPITTPSYEQWRQGKALQLLRTARNSPEAPIRFKSLHYMNNIIAKRELLSLGASIPSGAEGLMLSQDGFVAEGIVSNLFFVDQGKIYTPHVHTGILPGVTRAFIIDIARKRGFEVEEGFYTFAQIWGASEVWLTSSIQELIPVTELIDQSGNRKSISSGVVGAIGEELAGYYRKAAYKENEVT